jgi:hypothetical protein
MLFVRLTKPKKSPAPSEQKLGKPVPELPLHSSNSNHHLSIDTSSHDDQHQRSISTGDSPIILTRSISTATRHLHDEDQLTSKGRYLLGKYYNGPTQWLAPRSKTKGKQNSER